MFLQTVEFAEALETALLTVRPPTGSPGTRRRRGPRCSSNSHFRDMRARVFAKQSSTKWVELLTFDIPRVVLTK